MGDFKLSFRGAGAEGVIPIIPALAAEIGLNESILLRQFAHWIKIGDHFLDGEWWTYQTLRDIWEKLEGALSLGAIQRAIKELLNRGLIKETTRYNKRSKDKTRWFALCADALAKMKSIRLLNVAKSGDEWVESEWISPIQNGSECDPKQSDLIQNGSECDPKWIRVRSKMDQSAIQNGSTLPDSTTENTSEISPENTTKRTPEIVHVQARAPESDSAASDDSAFEAAIREGDGKGGEPNLTPSRLETDEAKDTPPVPASPPAGLNGAAAAVMDAEWERMQAKIKAAKAQIDFFDQKIVAIYQAALETIANWVAEYGNDFVQEVLQTTFERGGHSIQYARTILEDRLNKAAREGRKVGVKYAEQYSHLTEQANEFDLEAYKQRAARAKLEREGPPPPEKAAPPDGLTAADVVDYDSARREVNELRKRQSSVYVETFMLLVEIFEYRKWNAALCEWITDQMRNKRPITLMQIYDRVNRPTFPPKGNVRGLSGTAIAANL
jgi:hypothetical protein